MRHNYALLKASLQLRVDHKDCRQMLWHGSQSFYASSLLLPKETRKPASALYAFCRLADDAIDTQPLRSAAVGELYERLQRIYDGRPIDSPADRAMVEVVKQYRLPQTLLAALVEGFEWDVTGRRYNSLGDLYDYAARVAGTVGAMMAMLMDAKDADVIARACDLGVAMQLTNIARDVGEDARAGRVYLPIELLQRVDVDPDLWLTNPQFTPAIGLVTRQLLDAADKLYERATAGVAQLPVGCRPGIFAARLIYAEIGDVIRRNNYDSVSTRAIVTHARKVQLLGRAIAATARQADRDYTPPLKQTEFLVDAAAGAWA